VRITASSVYRPPRAGGGTGQYSRGRAASTDFAEDPFTVSLNSRPLAWGTRHPSYA